MFIAPETTGVYSGISAFQSTTSSSNNSPPVSSLMRILGTPLNDCHFKSQYKILHYHIINHIKFQIKIILVMLTKSICCAKKDGMLFLKDTIIHLHIRTLIHMFLLTATKPGDIQILPVRTQLAIARGFTGGHVFYHL